MMFLNSEMSLIATLFLQVHSNTTSKPRRVLDATSARKLGLIFCLTGAKIGHELRIKSRWIQENMIPGQEDITCE